MIHRRLDTRALLFRKRVKRNRPRRLPRRVELAARLLQLIKVSKLVPLPATLHFRAEDAVIRLWQNRVLVLGVVAIKRGASALEHKEALDARADGDALAFAGRGLDDAGFGAVAEEGVRVRFAVDGHAGPAVLDHVDVGDVDVGVALDEVGGEGAGEHFRGVDGVLLGYDVGCLLLGVCGHDYGIVCLCVSAGACEQKYMYDKHVDYAYEVSMSPSSIVLTVNS